MPKNGVEAGKTAASQNPLQLLERTGQRLRKHVGIGGEIRDRKISAGNFTIGSQSWNEPPSFAQNGFIFFFQTLRFHPVVTGFSCLKKTNSTAELKRKSDKTGKCARQKGRLIGGHDAH
jgi:hypothetical protein